MSSKVFITTIVFSLLLFAGIASAQSTSQDFPTPVMTNEIVGAVNARDIGDSRLTTYYFTFYGDQGDLFVNIVTKNFTGDLRYLHSRGTAANHEDRHLRKRYRKRDRPSRILQKAGKTAAPRSRTDAERRPRYIQDQIRRQLRRCQGIRHSGGA